MSLSFHIGILPNHPAMENIELAVAIEQMGYDGVWLADSHSVFRGACELLAVIASRTGELTIASGITETVTRHPAVIANSWATLNELAPGRTMMCFGIGDSAVANLGLKPERLSVFEEKIQVIRKLVKGETTQFENNDVQLGWASTDIPIFIASTGPKSLRMAGRIADGVLFQVGATPACTRYAIDNIRAGAKQAGRDPEAVKLYCRLATAVHKDRELARNQVKGYCSVAALTTCKAVPRQYFDDLLWEDLNTFRANYNYRQHGSNAAEHKTLLTDRIIDAVSVAGTPEEAIPRLQSLIELGVQGFVMPAAMDDPLPFLQTFMDEVIPQLTS